MVERNIANVDTGVRFSSPAHMDRLFNGIRDHFFSSPQVRENKRFQSLAISGPEFDRLRTKFQSSDRVQTGFGAADLTVGDLVDIQTVYTYVTYGGVTSMNTQPLAIALDTLGLGTEHAPEIQKLNSNQPLDRTNSLYTIPIDLDRLMAANSKYQVERGLELAHMPGGISISHQDKSNPRFIITFSDRQQSDSRTGKLPILRAIFNQLGLPTNLT